MIRPARVIRSFIVVVVVLVLSAIAVSPATATSNMAGESTAAAVVAKPASNLTAFTATNCHWHYDGSVYWAHCYDTGSVYWFQMHIRCQSILGTTYDQTSGYVRSPDNQYSGAVSCSPEAAVAEWVDTQG
jgi:hypothetical protein